MELSPRRTRAVLVVVALSLMAVISAVSGLNVALPEMARETGATQTQLTWIVDAYTVVFAGLLLFAGALGIALVAFAEAIGPANEFARAHGGKVDPNRELVAIGAANTSAGLFSGFPIGSSLSKSAANDRAGAKTPASLVTAAAATALVALFLTPIFEPLPEAILGAIVIVAVTGMMKVGKMRKLWELRRADFWLAMVALVGVLVMPTLQALALAVLASLAILIWRTSEPRLTFLGRARGGLESVDLRSAPDAAVPGLLIVRPDEMLFFGNVTSVRDGILAAAEATQPRLSVVLLDVGLTPEADIPVVEALEDLHGRLAANGIELWLCRVRPAVRDLLDRAGVLEHIGVERVYPREIEGMMAFMARMTELGDREAVLTDLLAFVRERRARPGASAEATELMDALEQRVSDELAMAKRAEAADQAPGPG